MHTNAHCWGLNWAKDIYTTTELKLSKHVAINKQEYNRGETFYLPLLFHPVKKVWKQQMLKNWGPHLQSLTVS